MTSGRLESPGAAPQGQGPDLAGLSLQHTDPGLQRVEVMRSVNLLQCTVADGGRNK